MTVDAYGLAVTIAPTTVDVTVAARGEPLADCSRSGTGADMLACVSAGPAASLHVGTLAMDSVTGGDPRDPNTLWIFVSAWTTVAKLALGDGTGDIRPGG